MDRSALKSFMDARAGIVTPPGKGRRGWPEGQGYLTSQPRIQRLQIDHVVAEGLGQVLDHQAGTITDLELHELSIPLVTRTVHQEGGATISKIRESSAR
jgi:hypothetical protein